MVERQIAARGIRDKRVLGAMLEIPRHLFIPPPYDRSAYDDNPLPIGNGQTISQPYIVALMTELLRPKATDNVLEIGAGSGYQAAVLSLLVRKLTTIERIAAVADLARRNLNSLGISNVTVIEGDGTLGYPAHAPYDGIIITAAAPAVPRPVIEQLAEEGILVAPIGGRDIQDLVILHKKGGNCRQEYYGGVRFVPLIGRYGWEN
ncbi:MAG: Protein-L-isoaspartate O-methyltransferase [Methanoregula sp. PtaU1.Bin006]|nr:MAG: Protein-L-isoaspartate O-methyltransferase [Methanoregula sp. PtaB.Bin085]OPY33993.1 MAG: Protein-L-isoaspartate O-methyltransferase [Methanoregula sp. PtaU1.Bin006]